MGHVYIACACDEHYAGDALACAQAIASGTTTPCGCACHTARELGDPVAVLEEQLAVASQRCEDWKKLAQDREKALELMRDKLQRLYKEISAAEHALNCGLSLAVQKRLQKLLLEQ